MLTRTIITRAAVVFLASATLPLGCCNAQGEEPETSIAFRIGSSKPAPGLIEYRLLGREISVFAPELDVVNGDHVERISFSQRDPQGRTAVGLFFTDEGIEKLKVAASKIEPTPKSSPPDKGATGPGITPHKRVVILIDGEVIAAPSLYGAIPKDASITANFGDDALLKIFKAVVLGRESDEPDIAKPTLTFDTTEIAKQLLDTIALNYDQRLVEYRGGGSTPERLIELNRELYDEQIQAVPSHQRKVVAERFLERAKTIEDIANQHVANGIGLSMHVLDAKAARLRATVELGVVSNFAK